MEQKVIGAAITSREAFDEILSTQIDNDFTDQAKIIWRLIKEYYGADPEARHVDTDVLKSTVQRKQPKHADLFIDYIDSLGEVSCTNVLKEAIAVKLEAARHKLAQELIAGKDEKVDNLLEEYHRLRLGEIHEENTTEIYRGLTAQEILANTSADNRIALLPSSLNNQIKGGVLRGHHVVIFAPTDMGKSLFALNMAYGITKQGYKTLYVGNEDPAKDMMERIFWRFSGMPETEISKDPARADEVAFGRNYNNFIFAEVAPGTPREIEELIDEHKPDALVVDQIRNLDMGESNKVLQLEAAASFMRRMGKKHNLVPISLTQAADSATGKMFLQRGDIDYSNVGIPGTADLLIGIGATDDMEMHGERMLSFVKNKVSGQKNPLKVWFDPLLTKVQ